MSLTFHLTKCDVFYIWYGKKDNESWDVARKTKGFENKKSAQIYVPFGRCIKKIKYGLVWSSPWQDISREYRHHTSSFLIAEINRNTHPSTRTVNAIAHNCAPKAHSDASVCDKIYILAHRLFFWKNTLLTIIAMVLITNIWLTRTFESLQKIFCFFKLIFDITSQYVEKNVLWLTVVLRQLKKTVLK